MVVIGSQVSRSHLSTSNHLIILWLDPSSHSLVDLQPKKQTRYIPDRFFSQRNLPPRSSTAGQAGSPFKHRGSMVEEEARAGHYQEHRDGVSELERISKRAFVLVSRMKFLP